VALEAAALAFAGISHAASAQHQSQSCIGQLCSSAVRIPVIMLSTYTAVITHTSEALMMSRVFAEEVCTAVCTAGIYNGMSLAVISCCNHSRCGGTNTHAHISGLL